MRAGLAMAVVPLATLPGGAAFSPGPWISWQGAQSDTFARAIGKSPTSLNSRKLHPYATPRTRCVTHGIDATQPWWNRRGPASDLGTMDRLELSMDLLDVGDMGIKSGSQEATMTALGGRGRLGSGSPGRGNLAINSDVGGAAAQSCSRLLGPEAVYGDPGMKLIKAKGDRNGGSGAGGSGGGGGEGGRGGGDGKRGNAGRGHATMNNGTAIPLSDASFGAENGVEMDETLVRRSPIVRSFAPVFRFFKSRAGLYGMMLAYVMFTLSQHITPVYLGVSFLSIIAPSTARRALVVCAQSVSVLTVASYIQDQFRHQVYPLPAVVAGPSAPYALITGASSGIGREIANELAARGYNLLLVSRGKEGLKLAARELREASREAAEAAKREQEGEDADNSAKPQSKRERKRRLREERAEKRRRAASVKLSADDQRDRAGDRSASNSSELDDQIGNGWLERQQEAAEEAFLPAPHLANAITARWFAADLSNVTDVVAVHNEVERLNITVEILVNAAGVCRVGRLESVEEDDLRRQLELNVVGTSLLTRLFAKDFVRRRQGRIMVVSSVTAAAPNPSVAAYAASKSFLTSFAEALHSELEIAGVGVTCVMPGATKTNFEDNSGASAALVWRIPLCCMEADEVAARGVEALMRGDRTVIPGWQNKLYVHVLAPLLPRKILMSFAEAMWR